MGLAPDPTVDPVERRRPLRIRRGRRYVHTVTIVDKAIGDGIDVSGNEFAMQIRRTADSTYTLAELDVVMTNAAAGIVQFTLAVDVTAALPESSPTALFRSDVRMDDETIESADVIVESSVTRG